MKLRNKKTGEIVDYKDFQYDLMSTYNSIAEFNEEWEDYNLKEHYFISEFGKVYSVEGVFMDKQHIEWLKQIGNYYKTKEEAEKVVENLRYLKQLNIGLEVLNTLIQRNRLGGKS